MHDDTTQTSPTVSDHDRPRPSQSDHDRQRPTMSATRSDHHTMTTTEVVKLFEDSALPREKRSIERYCEQGKLDCFKDPDEMRYYISPASAEQLIGHLKELKGRHPQPPAPTASSPGATHEHDMRPDPTLSRSAADMKHETQQNRMSETEREAYEQKLKVLEDQIFNLEVDKRAKDQVVTLLRDQLKDDRDHYSDKLTKYGRRLGQLETEVKQLQAPQRDTTRNDNDAFNDEAIDVEFREANRQENEDLTRVSTNSPQP